MVALFNRYVVHGPTPPRHHLRNRSTKKNLCLESASEASILSSFTVAMATGFVGGTTHHRGCCRGQGSRYAEGSGADRGGIAAVSSIGAVGAAAEMMKYLPSIETVRAWILDERVLSPWRICDRVARGTKLSDFPLCERGVATSGLGASGRWVFYGGGWSGE